MPLATLTSKGQITIPKTVRDILKLEVGGKVDFQVLEDGSVLLHPVTNTVDDIFGRLHHPLRKAVSINEMDEGIRRKVRAEKT
jgi:AbrB family looped-hinge helix DNA binding protein